jgi:hypothetical protein
MDLVVEAVFDSPSPLVAEGALKSAECAVGTGEEAWRSSLPPSLRSGTLSHLAPLRWGRGKKLTAYLGAMRMAPSRRMVSPFSIGFSTI